MRDIQKAKDLFNKLYGGEFLENDQDLKEIMIHYLYGDVYMHGQLDMKLRESILIVVNTTNHTLKALKEHVVTALRIGVTPIQIKEMIYQCTPYIGLGKVEDALESVHEVFIKEDVQLPIESQSRVNEATRFKKGFAVQSEIFTEAAIQAGHDHAPQELKHIQNYLSEYCFGDFYTRSGLDIQTRELMTFVILATLGGCENQLKAHIKGNLNVGNTREVLIETITQCQPYIGFPRTLNAIQMINEITNQ